MKSLHIIKLIAIKQLNIYFPTVHTLQNKYTKKLGIFS